MRLRDLWPFSKRSFEAAGGGRRWRDARAVANPNAAIIAAGATLATRANHASLNHAAAVAGVGSLVSNLWGTGAKPQSQHPDEKIRAALNLLYEEWTDSADADGVTDAYGLKGLAVRMLLIDGECFVRREFAPGAKVPLRLRLIAADQVDRAMTRDLGNGSRIIAGVEFDGSNRRTAYHIFKTRPGDPFALATSLDLVRVPASEMIHLFVPITAGQVRGVSALASVLLRLGNLDKLEDAALMREQIAAMMVGTIIDPEGSAAGLKGEQSGSILESGLEPGSLKVLPPGTDIKFSSPPTGGNTDQVIKHELRAIAAGIGTTYEQISGDLSGVNYSSIRAGLVEFRRRCDMVRHNVIAFQLCRPVWRWFVTAAVLGGALQARDFETNTADYLKVRWVFPGWDWVDPKSDAEAAVIAVNSGFRSRRDVVAERGVDIETLDAEIAADNARAAKLGLKFDVQIKPQANNAPTSA